MSRRQFETLPHGALMVFVVGLTAWWATRDTVSARVEPSSAKFEDATFPDARSTDVALAMPSANRELESSAQYLDAESPTAAGDAIVEYLRYANGGPPSDRSGRPKRILQGLVVDDRGQPMQSAEIVAAVRDRVAGETDAAIVNRWEASDVFECLGVPGAKPCSRASSSPDGTFTLEGIPIDGDIVLAATFGGLMSDLIAVGAGKGPVQIALPRDGSLFGRIEGGATLPFMDVRVRWWRTDDGRFGKQLAGEQKADELFAIWLLAPGVYSVAVSSKEAHAVTELARVDGVVVRSGDPTHDGRLDPVELQSRLRTVVVDVVGSDGQAIDGFRGWWCTTDGAFLTLPERLKSSRITIAAPIAIPRDYAAYEFG